MPSVAGENFIEDTSNYSEKLSVDAALNIILSDSSSGFSFGKASAQSYSAELLRSLDLKANLDLLYLGFGHFDAGQGTFLHRAFTAALEGEFSGEDLGEQIKSAHFIPFLNGLRDAINGAQSQIKTEEKNERPFF